MLNIPIVRWGQDYASLELEEIRHFLSGEVVARVSQANGGLLQRDMRRADRAREVLREIPCADLIDRCHHAADLYEDATLRIGDGIQSPQDFVRQQSATTGLPEHMCRANMAKNAYVLRHMAQILDCLTRGLDLRILTRGFGEEERGVIVSYQAQSPVLGAVLPSNSPGVHTLWLPAIPLQLGLVLKPGSQEPWTVYRMMAAWTESGIPREVFSLYPGGHDVGAALLAGVPRAMLFGGTQTVQQYAGNPRVQVHGAGFSKILLGDDVVDHWEQYLDLMVESIFVNGGRSCINCSSIWASRHTREIAQALAERLGPVDVLPPEDPNAGLAAFTMPGVAQGVHEMLAADLREAGVTDMTHPYGTRLVERERCAYLRPVILHCDSPAVGAAQREFMFPCAAVVACAQDQMLAKLGPTLVCSAITRDLNFIRHLTDAVHIDRLNIGAIPTNRLNWLQPHEGNLIDFLFRSRAYQVSDDFLAGSL